MTMVANTPSQSCFGNRTMNNSQSTERKWHPIEHAIMLHIDRYGMTTPAAAVGAGVRGMTTELIALKRLEALVRRQHIIKHALAPGNTCYSLSEVARTRLGRNPAMREKPPSPRLLFERFAFLSFCCLSHQKSTKLTHAEMSQRFPDLYRPAMAHHYYVSTDHRHSRLGFLRVDGGNSGRWDRVASKLAQDVHHHLNFDLVRTLLEQDAFEFTVVTPLAEKAISIQEAMMQRRDAFPVPVHCVSMPELVNLIRPSPG